MNGDTVARDTCFPRTEGLGSIPGLVLCCQPSEVTFFGLGLPVPAVPFVHGNCFGPSHQLQRRLCTSVTFSSLNHLFCWFPLLPHLSGFSCKLNSALSLVPEALCRTGSCLTEGPLWGHPLPGQQAQIRVLRVGTLTTESYLHGFAGGTYEWSWYSPTLWLPHCTVRA